MKCRMFGTVMICVMWAAVSGSAADDKNKAAAKKALQDLNEFVGPWKGLGETKSGKSESWKEDMDWGWKFKGEDSSLVVKFKDDKNIQEGEMTYVPEKKVFQLKVKDKDGKEKVFEGNVKGKRLVLAWTDPESTDRHILTLSTNNDGLRFIQEYAVQTKGKGLEKRLYLVEHKKEGTSIAGGGKKNECVVSGGIGTIPVSYGGKTYYVCCSGCRDAFMENPKKFVDEFEKKSK